ncbi:MAG: Holliday junction branch migration protein RuvA [Candidatus Eisenbacteria bacterium]
MIASVRGIVLEKGDGSCVIEAGGVGYLLQVSTQTLAVLSPAGAEAKLLTRHVVREDAQLLFGFLDADELRLFDLLITVNGVGPKLALAALSGLKPAMLARAIRDEDLPAIVRLPGIGRKTAERMVVELRDKLDFVAMAPTAAHKGGTVRAQDARLTDAVAALVTLGYSSAQAHEAVQRVAATEPDLTLEALVKRTLAGLGRSAILTR